MHAPWTSEQVDNLNEFQLCGMVHPFTCQNHSRASLIAFPDGWVCQQIGCNYKQTWAHDFMADGSMVKHLMKGLPKLRLVKADPADFTDFSTLV